jgi:hypothetical protein
MASLPTKTCGELPSSRLRAFVVHLHLPFIIHHSAFCIPLLGLAINWTSISSNQCAQFGRLVQSHHVHGLGQSQHQVTYELEKPGWSYSFDCQNQGETYGVRTFRLGNTCLKSASLRVRRPSKREANPPINISATGRFRTDPARFALT